MTGLDGVIVATDPRAHAAYLRWAAARELDALVDKPVTAHHRIPHDRFGDRLLSDFDELAARFAASSGEATVMASRRVHEGYRWLESYLADFVAEFGVSVTHVDVRLRSGSFTPTSIVRCRDRAFGARPSSTRVAGRQRPIVVRCGVPSTTFETAC